MNFVLDMAVHIVLGVLASFVKNPKRKEEVKQNLLSLADDIYMEYGLTPPQQQ